MKSTYVVTVLFEFDIIPLWFCSAGKCLNLKTFAKLVAQKFVDKSDFHGLLVLFAFQLKRYLVSFLSL